MIPAVGKLLRSNDVSGRLGVIAAAALYALLAVALAVFIVRLQQAESRMHDFLANDDRSMFNRTSVEFARSVEAVLRSAAAPAPGDAAEVRERFDILQNRLSVFQADSDATRFVNGVPAFMEFEAALEATLQVSDAVFARETNDTLSTSGKTQLLSALDALRPRLESTIAAVVAMSARRRDVLQKELDQLHVLMDASVIGLAVASLLFIVVLARNNRLIKRANHQLNATAALLGRSEARLNAFLRNAPAVMTIVDRARRFELVNAETERFYGLRAAELVGRRGIDLRSTTGQRALEDLKQSVLDTGQPQSLQIRHETSRGEVWKLSFAFPIYDEEGRIDAIGGIGLDISELKKSEAEVIRQRERAEAASQTKSRMLANASHELRTPLNAIVGFGQVIEGEMFGPIGTSTYREYASDIVRSGQHLVGVIDAVLNLSRAESGQADLRETRCDAGQLVASAITLVEDAAARAGLRIAVHRIEAPEIMVDRGKLTQALVNLLSNAIKFTQHGGRIDVSYRADPGYGAEIIVSDSGIGISEAELDQVVLPFTRGGSAMVRKQEGSGLGLAITKALIEEHGGQLELESKLGSGTKATIRLPVERIRAAMPRSRSA
jgi:PAS domain S-box-containing protein